MGETIRDMIIDKIIIPQDHIGIWDLEIRFSFVEDTYYIDYNSVEFDDIFVDSEEFKITFDTKISDINNWLSKEVKSIIKYYEEFEQLDDKSDW